LASRGRHAVVMAQSTLPAKGATFDANGEFVSGEFQSTLPGSAGLVWLADNAYVSTITGEGTHKALPLLIHSPRHSVGDNTRLTVGEN
jgi:hypothetical protein